MTLKDFGRASNKQIMPGYLNLECWRAYGAENVRNMWLHHYQSLLNSIPDSPVHIHKIDKYCSNIQFNDNMVKVKELKEIISNMPVGKASGYDHN